MDVRKFNIPFFLKIEEGLLEELSSILRSNVKDKKKAIVGIDAIVKNIYGDIVISEIEKVFDEVKIIDIDTNDLELSFDIARIVINESFDTIIGIGGGRVLDVCKYASNMSKVYYVSIPTAIAHDGVASPIAVLKCNNEIKSLGAKVPDGIIVDLDVISKAPKNLIKAGIGDTLSNYTAIKDWKLENKNKGKEIDDFAILLSELSIKSVLNHCDKNIENKDFIKTVVEACIMSGLAMSLAGSSRPCSGAEHLISHAMDTLNKNNLHGIQVGISSIIANYLHEGNPEKIVSFLEIFGLPTTLEAIGLDFEDFKYIMRNATKTRPGRYTILNEINLSDENLEKIFKDCFNR